MAKKTATACCELFKASILAEVGKLEAGDTEGQDFKRIKATIHSLPCLCDSPKPKREKGKWIEHVEKCRQSGESWFDAIKRCKATYQKKEPAMEERN